MYDMHVPLPFALLIETEIEAHIITHAHLIVTGGDRDRECTRGSVPAGEPCVGLGGSSTGPLGTEGESAHHTARLHTGTNELKKIFIFGVCGGGTHLAQWKTTIDFSYILSQPDTNKPPQCLSFGMKDLLVPGIGYI